MDAPRSRKTAGLSSTWPSGWRRRVNVPAILHRDLERGFLLLTDMGTETWLTALDDGNADAWFSAALDALIAQQRHADVTGLPACDRALLRRELDLFRDWYLDRHRGWTWTATGAAGWTRSSRP